MENFKKEVKWLLKEKYNNKPTEQFKKDIIRLKNGEPLDYVIGFTNFLGCKIDLSKKPLIPRPETEFWVERALKQMSHKFSTCEIYETKVLDIFSGSGCIGIAVLKHIKNSFVVFADNDKNAIKQIKINCKINNINKKRYKIIQSDVFKGLNPSSQRLLRTKYDLVFANPPYIAKTNKNIIQKTVLKFEPKTALFGGGDGLFYIKKFLEQAPAFAKASSSAKATEDKSDGRGKIFMEFSPEQKKEIEKLLKKFEYKNYEFHKDQHSRWRWVFID
ncbi:MAG: peptide chain release factor N(5)-glutamine methyltransferase [Patescibacteria group bacterium]